MITLCLIAKNETEELRRAVLSAKEVSDKVVIGLTGSSEATRKVARSLGAQICTVPWRDDFSLARNSVLEHAEEGWCLFLDADEELTEGHDALKHLDRVRFFEAFELQIDTPGPEGPISSFSALRLFRSHLRYKWPIHEQIDVSPYLVGQLPVKITHHGGVQSASNHKKRQRNQKLIDMALKKDPDNAFLHFCAGNEAYMGEEWEKALVHYRAAYLSSDIGGPWHASAGRNIAACVDRLGQPGEAGLIAGQVVSLYPDFTDLFYLMGQIQLRLGDKDTAKSFFRQCLTMKDPPKSYFSWGGTGSWRAKEALAKLEASPKIHVVRNG